MMTNLNIEGVARRLIALGNTMRDGVDVQLSYDLTLNELVNLCAAELPIGQRTVAYALQCVREHPVVSCAQRLVEDSWTDQADGIRIPRHLHDLLARELGKLFP